MIRWTTEARTEIARAADIARKTGETDVVTLHVAHGAKDIWRYASCAGRDVEARNRACEVMCRYVEMYATS